MLARSPSPHFSLSHHLEIANHLTSSAPPDSGTGDRDSSFHPPTPPFDPTGLPLPRRKGHSRRSPRPPPRRWASFPAGKQGERDGRLFPFWSGPTMQRRFCAPLSSLFPLLFLLSETPPKALSSVIPTTGKAASPPESSTRLTGGSRRRRKAQPLPPSSRGGHVGRAPGLPQRTTTPDNLSFTRAPRGRRPNLTLGGNSAKRGLEIPPLFFKNVEWVVPSPSKVADHCKRL